jgi:hypothetical protein
MPFTGRFLPEHTIKSWYMYLKKNMLHSYVEISSTDDVDENNPVFILYELIQTNKYCIWPKY